MKPRYWLDQWLDEKEVSAEWEIDHILNTQHGLQSLIETVRESYENEQQQGYVYPDQSSVTDSIVAGRRLDLSGSLSCSAYDCLRNNIDNVFKNVWHYFDNIVVEGITPSAVTEALRSDRHESFHTMLYVIREQARLLLYCRSIGADRYITYAQKTLSLCSHHWSEYARSLGMPHLYDKSVQDHLIHQILDSMEYEVEKYANDSWLVSVTSAAFQEPRRLILSGGSKPDGPDIAGHLFNNLATAAISDIGIAQRLSLPIIEPTNIDWMSQRAKNRRKSGNNTLAPTAADVALQMNLPVFDNLTTADFLKLREDERPDFEAFRAALRIAITKRIEAVGKEESAAAIARNVVEEYLRPGLAEIERKMRSSRQAVVKKSSVNLTIGAAAVGVAAVGPIPLSIAAGIAALGSAIPVAPVFHKYIEDKNAAKLSDLYFLWHVTKRSGHK